MSEGIEEVIRPKKVLVVDDESMVRHLLRKFLQARGYEVIKAQDGDEALQAYEQSRPDVVLLDVLMPGKSGLQTLQELRARDPGATVIMVSAVGDDEAARQATTEGAFDYITKPIDPSHLESCLKMKFTSRDG